MTESSDILEQDPRIHPNEWSGSVLLSDEIEHFSREYKLIHPFYDRHLNAANYNLTLGSECRIGGKPTFLDEKNPYLIIPPYQMAVVSTTETINLPRFLIARWNLRVTLVYDGLLWVGGPQVDPGYRGKLFCPLYNLSNRKITLRLYDPIFTIDFIKTTIYNEKSKLKAFQKTKKVKLSDYDTHVLTSGPFESSQQVLDIKKEVETFRTLVLSLIGLIFTSLALLARIATIGDTPLEMVQTPIFMIIIAAISTFITGWMIGKNS